MKKLAFLIFLSIVNSIAFGEVTGNAFLENQTDHSGIKVKFIPNSPTAVLDSTYSIVDGSYSSIIEPGVYYVIYSKQGYQTLFLNDGNPVVITVNSNLGSVTLLQGNIIYLSGNINGTLTPENIYIVTANVNILANETLFIEPGTIIKFESQCSMNVYGLLSAIGTEENKITFTSSQSNPSSFDWDYFKFGESSQISVLNHCIIEYAIKVDIDGGSVIIESCEFRYLYSGLDSYYPVNIQVSNSYFHNFTYVGIKIAGLPDSYLIKKNIIELNIESSSIMTGISVGSSLETAYIENNLIYNPTNQYSYYTYGIDLSGCNTHLSNNIINNCGFGILSNYNVNAVLTNNIISNNVITGIEVGAFYPNCNWIIQSNLIVGNNVGIQTTIDNQPVDISYNNVWGNIEYYFSDIPGLGNIITNNNNGDPCDPYYNISLDPLFVDTAGYNFHVYDGSPVIDAGSNINVISEFDLDGNPRILDGNGDGNPIVDMGVYEVPVELILTSDFSCPDSVCANDDVTIQFLGSTISGATFNWNFDGGIIESGSGQGPFQVYWDQPGLKTLSLSVSLGDNYSDTTYNSIMVLPSFDVSISIDASSNPICTGDEVTFTAFPVNGGESPTYQWKLNGQNVGNNSPIYTNSSLVAGNMVYCYLTSSEVCVLEPTVQSNVIYMGVFQYPLVTIAAFPNDTTCITENITLNAGNPGCTYLWSTGQTTQQIVVSNTSGPSGGLEDYNVVVTKGGICSGYDTISVYFDPCTGLNEIIPESKIKIFPNPANEMLNIELTGINSDVMLSILSPDGKMIQKQKASPVNYTIQIQLNLSELQKGIYLLKVENSDFIEVKTFIRE